MKGKIITGTALSLMAVSTFGLASCGPSNSSITATICSEDGSAIEYQVDESLKTDEMYLNLTSSDGSAEKVKITEDMITSMPDLSTRGEKTIVVKYKGKEYEIKINVTGLTRTEIAELIQNFEAKLKSADKQKIKASLNYNVNANLLGSSSSVNYSGPITGDNVYNLIKYFGENGSISNSIKNDTKSEILNTLLSGGESVENSLKEMLFNVFVNYQNKQSNQANKWQLSQSWQSIFSQIVQESTKIGEKYLDMDVILNWFFNEKVNKEIKDAVKVALSNDLDTTGQIKVSALIDKLIDSIKDYKNLSFDKITEYTRQFKDIVYTYSTNENLQKQVQEVYNKIQEINESDTPLSTAIGCFCEYLPMYKGVPYRGYFAGVRAVYYDNDKNLWYCYWYYENELENIKGELGDYFGSYDNTTERVYLTSEADSVVTEKEYNFVLDESTEAKEFKSSMINSIVEMCKIVEKNEGTFDERRTQLLNCIKEAKLINDSYENKNVVNTIIKVYLCDFENLLVSYNTNILVYIKNIYIGNWFSEINEENAINILNWIDAKCANEVFTEEGIKELENLIHTMYGEIRESREININKVKDYLISCCDIFSEHSLLNSNIRQGFSDVKEILTQEDAQSGVVKAIKFMGEFVPVYSSTGLDESEDARTFVEGLFDNLSSVVNALINIPEDNKEEFDACITEIKNAIQNARNINSAYKNNSSLTTGITYVLNSMEVATDCCYDIRELFNGDISKIVSLLLNDTVKNQITTDLKDLMKNLLGETDAETFASATGTFIDKVKDTKNLKITDFGDYIKQINSIIQNSTSPNIDDTLKNKCNTIKSIVDNAINSNISISELIESISDFVPMYKSVPNRGFFGGVGTVFYDNDKNLWYSMYCFYNSENELENIKGKLGDYFGSYDSTTRRVYLTSEADARVYYKVYNLVLDESTEAKEYVSSMLSKFSGIAKILEQGEGLTQDNKSQILTLLQQAKEINSAYSKCEEITSTIGIILDNCYSFVNVNAEIDTWIKLKISENKTDIAKVLTNLLYQECYPILVDSDSTRATLNNYFVGVLDRYVSNQIVSIEDELSKFVNSDVINCFTEDTQTVIQSMALSYVVLSHAGDTTYNYNELFANVQLPEFIEEIDYNTLFARLYSEDSYSFNYKILDVQTNYVLSDSGEITGEILTVTASVETDVVLAAFNANLTATFEITY